jgi:tetratricopeptide (TPR) repeat protein
MPQAELAECRRLWDAGQRTDALRHALASWPAVLAGGSEGDLVWLSETLRAVGLPAESSAAQLAVVRRRQSPERWAQFLRSILGSGDPWWARELLAEAGTATRALAEVRLDVAVELAEDVGPLVEAWLRAHQDAPGRAAAVQWLVAGGRAAEAEALLARTDDLPLWRARLALWRGDAAAARASLRDAPAGREAEAMAAIATCLDGDDGRAEPLLRAVIASAGPNDEHSAECWSWLAPILRRRGRYDDAVRAADAAKIASRYLLLAPRLERELAVEQLPRRRPWWAPLQRLVRRRPGRRIGDLEYAAMVRGLGCAPDDPIDALQGALDRLRGNRGPYPTVVENGRLVSLRLPPDPRQIGATIQRVLWTRGPGAARALYHACPPALRDHPLCLIYRGELELWMGDYADAERIFRAILARDRAILWAWIGLGASRMFQGDLDGAQRIWEEGGRERHFQGPTQYAYQGECFRLQGDATRARQALETALAQKPQRLSARINLALIERTTAALEDALRHCESFAPFLMDALPGDPPERLEGVLRAMRGNRSSSPWMMSYHLFDHLWRRAS